ncbi:MAG TPA: hypothetical protein DCP90_09310 [Clostridiales bacterium]|nr:MAG: hypothetical protein A2Y22_04700 [Clostridiales bacterium GWD2_32_59]HAN10791.1 hypothetical protein [Clostridiales bacterium]
MSYIEILITTVILGIIMIPITMSMTDNVYTVAENVGLERAVTIAQKEIGYQLIGLASTPVEGYTVIKDIQAAENYVKVTVTWKVAGESKEYVLYGTIPVTDYNS